MRVLRASAFIACLGAAASVLGSAAGAPAATALTTLKATYAISIAGIVVGKAEVESRFSGSGYAPAIVGSTSGVSRLASDASARLTGNGHIFGSQVLPATYD